MTKEERKLIDLLKFHVNEKANNATTKKIRCCDENKTNRANFYQGQYMAFNEIYSMLLNLEKTL